MQYKFNSKIYFPESEPVKVYISHRKEKEKNIY